MLLAAAQGAGQLLAALGQHRKQLVNPLQGLGGSGPVGLGKRTQVQVFLNGQGTENAATFRRMGDPHADQAMRGHFVDGSGLEANFAPRRAQQATDGVQGSGFAGAIRAENGDDFALPDMQIDTVQRLDVAVADMQIFDFKQHVVSIRHGCVS